MKIITRYIGIMLFKRFASLLLAVAGIYIAVDFFEKIDDFMEAGLPYSKAASFFLLRTPFVLAQIAPVGVLLSCLVVFGVMTRQNEITAFRAGGGKPSLLMRPVVGLGIFAMVFLFLLVEMASPLATRKANFIWHVEVRKERPISGREADIWFSAKGSIIHIGRFSKSDNVAQGVIINEFFPDFSLKKRIDAKKGFYEKGLWHLENVVVQDFQNGHTVKHMDGLSVKLGFSDRDLSRVVRRTDEMTYKQLRDYAKKLESEGFDATRLRVDLAARLAFPFVCLIMGLLGGTIGIIWGKEGRGIAISIVAGIGLAFGYWVIYSMCLSLGYAGTLPPSIAAWATNIIFSVIVLSLFLKLE